MKIHNTLWIDRYYNRQENLLDTLLGPLQKQFVLLFDNRFFHFSILVKNLIQTLAFTNVSLQHYSFLKGICVSLMLLFGVAVFLLTAKTILSPLFLIVIIFGLVGFIIPDLYIIDKEQQLLYEIHNDFPRFLDLLYIYTSSAAFDHIGNSMYDISRFMTGSLAHQLRDVTAIYRFVDLNTFLTKFEEKFKVPLAKDFVATIRLSNKYGGDMSTKIGILANEAHKERMQTARQKGQNASAMLLIPLMLFHFPVAVIIFLAPTAIALKEIFGW